MSQKPQQNGTSDVIKVRYEKLDALKEAGRYPFVITTSARDVLTETIKNNFEEYEKQRRMRCRPFAFKKRQSFVSWTFGIVRKSRFLQSFSILLKKNTVLLEKVGYR